MIWNRYVKRKKACPTEYLTFSSDNPFTIAVNNATKNWNGILLYSTDTENWTKWDGTSAISSGFDNESNVIYMAGTRNTIITGNSADYKWVLSGSNIKCTGNIETLLNWEAVITGNHPTMGEYCYAYIFRDCTGLTQAPELPATTLTDSCYSYMFNGCTGLTRIPALPATTLANSCYVAMFQDCTGLTQAPALPAMTLADSCYKAMFYGCTGLTQAPELPATTLTDRCYSSMFYGCTGLTRIPALPATTLANSCYKSMFGGCSKIKLSSTQTGEYTQAYRIPTSGTGTTAMQALNNMFGNTGGTFTGTPTINTTYYLSNTNTVVER